MDGQLAGNGNRADTAAPRDGMVERVKSEAHSASAREPIGRHISGHTDLSVLFAVCTDVHYSKFYVLRKFDENAFGCV